MEKDSLGQMSVINHADLNVQHIELTEVEKVKMLNAM